jgi:uncharacterized protein (TIGR03437 family)
MGAERKFDLDRRLEAYFATLHSSSLKEALKRSAGNWQIYAAVTGSALAMATNASASIIGSEARDTAVEPTASVRDAKQSLLSSRTMPVLNAVRLAMARQDSGQRLLNGASLEIGHASPAPAPTISAGGVVPLFGTVSTIQPGEWVSIYGSNLAGGNATWDGDFPTSLGGTSVKINGNLAYLQFVSPTQINLQAPNDTATGTVPVVVTTGSGSATTTVTLSRFAPSFNLLAGNHVSGIILRPSGSGAYGKGANSYDILGPTGNSLGYPTVAAQAGDTVELFGGGFGPTTPVVPAGQAFSGSAPANDTVSLYIDNVVVKPTFVGLSSAGLYQFNLTVPPGLGQGDVPISAMVGGIETQPRVLFSLQYGSNIPPVGGTVGGTGGPPGFFSSGGGGFTGGGSGGGSGGGGSFRKPGGKKRYEPKLRFQ